jgi:hypothetical protein
MKTVYSAPHLFMVQHFNNILASQGINAVIKNEYLSGGAGELPPTECWPMLCVEDRDAERAEAIIQKVMADDNHDKTPWVCPRCGEIIEPQFEWCWNCGYAGPDEGNG